MSPKKKPEVIRDKDDPRIIIVAKGGSDQEPTEDQMKALVLFSIFDPHFYSVDV